jgi:hypothetical protein
MKGLLKNQKQNNMGATIMKDNSVLVLLDGKPVWLDLENLKDDDLCMRDADDGSFETINGEQHFSHYNAPTAAERQGKRLFTNEENYFISNLPCRRDNEKRGLWITFNLVDGGTKEVFFPAAGHRSASSGSLSYVGSNGLYWSASPVSSTSNYASYLHFNSGTVGVIYNYYRADGRSVRCVRDIN